MLRPEPWVLMAVAAVSAGLAFTAVFQAVLAIREWRFRRSALGTLREADLQHQAATAPDPDSVVRTRDDLERGLVSGLATRVPLLWDVQHVLAQSGLKWTLDGLAIRSGGAAALACVISLVLFRSPAVALVAGVLAGVSPYLYARGKKRRRIRQMEAQLPDAIDLIARAVRAGHPLSAGLGMASEEIPEPLASEFRITFEEQKFGLPFEEALRGLADRVEVVDVRILVTAILVQREAGGNLSEILETIAETMRARFNLKRQVRVYTAQGRMSGYTLAALPIFVSLAITIINPDYMKLMLHEPIGRGMLIGAGTLQLIGFLWIRKIVDVRF